MTLLSQPYLMKPICASWTVFALVLCFPVKAALFAEESTPLAAPIPVQLNVAPLAFADHVLTIQASVVEGNASRVEYQFLWDEEILQSWGTAPLVRRQLTEQDIGAHHVRVQVRSPSGQASQTQEIFIARHPIEPDDHAPQTRR